MAVFASGQGPAPIPKPHPACGAVEEVHGRPPKPPVVYGKPYIVPKLRLHVADEQTGVPVAEREVIVRYVWRWFEYPYQEHPLGVWSDAYDLVRCMTDKHGVVGMSEFKVVPRGWYRGKMLIGRKPEFTHLDVSVHLEKHLTHVRITKRELDRYKSSKADTIPLRVSFTSPVSQ
jgi:hypothetical protein